MTKVIGPSEQADKLRRLTPFERESIHEEFENISSRQAPTRRKVYALERRCIEVFYRRIGRPNLQFVLWDGTVVGDRQSSIGRVAFRRPRALSRLPFNMILGFCEGYVAHDLAIEGDLIEVLAEINRTLPRIDRHRWKLPLPRWLWSTHSDRESMECIHKHYNLGNDFYRLWLDEKLVYTCAYYARPEASLEEAQTSKLDHVSRKLRLKPGEKVVEAGCGWGALAMHMARHYGVSVRAFNLSHEQIMYARDRAQREGLSQCIEFIEDDYRNITGKCDAFVSVGMLEHVGRENYLGLGRLVSNILTEDGRGLIHNIGRNKARPLDPWTVKYIFPGAYAPSLREMMDLFEDDGFSVLDVENLRLHYARTCADWLARYENESAAVKSMFDEQFVRMWRLYLAAASAGFLSGDLQLFQVVFARSHNNQLPWTRRDWYA